MFQVLEQLEIADLGLRIADSHHQPALSMKERVSKSETDLFEAQTGVEVPGNRNLQSEIISSALRLSVDTKTLDMLMTQAGELTRQRHILPAVFQIR